MRGQPPRPKKQLERDGSWKAKGRLDDLAGAIGPDDIRVPEPPSRLSGDEKEIWRSIVALLGPKAVMTEADAHSLELLVCELHRYRRRKDQLGKIEQSGEADPATLRRVETSMEKAFANYVNMASRFGLTPADRARVKLPEPKTRVGAERFFGGGGVVAKIG